MDPDTALSVASTPGSFDCALAVEVLQYVENPLLTLKEFCRVLTPGGCIVGHVPVLGYLREYEQTLFDDVNLPAMLRESGFEDISITGTFGDGYPPTLQSFRMAEQFLGTHSLGVSFLTDGIVDVWGCVAERRL